ncbi:MAG: hypothetical protein V4564_18650 [Pseudomonadota bacterium]
MLEITLLPSNSRVTRLSHLAVLALAAFVLADLSFRLRPTGYFGGSSDEQRYLETALQWIIHGPHAGTTHWSLRHPLIIAIVASFRHYGITMDALQLVPRLFGDLLFAVTTVFVTRVAGLRSALIWLAIALTMPVFHIAATNAGPEIVELAFGAISLWAFWEGRDGGRRGVALMSLSGAALALALLTRETSACLLLVYGYAWLRGHARRSTILAFALGFVPVIAIDTVWLWALTGKPFYRLMVDQSHTGIYSAHLIGGIYHGRSYLNLDLASRWVPVGPVVIHWTIDPILNFLAAPTFALVFLAWLVLWWARSTRPLPNTLAARAAPWLFGIALACYVTVTWLLTIRPQPRYYLFAVYAATLAVALIAGQPMEERKARLIRRIMLALGIFTGTLTILLSPYRPQDAELILPWLKQHPAIVLHIAREDAKRMAFPAILAGRQAQISGAPTPIGALQVRFIVKPPGPGQWRQVTVLQGPWLFPYINPPRRLVIERRIG